MREENFEKQILRHVDRIFPNRTDRNFIEVLSANWLGLLNNRPCTAYWLHEYQRGKRGRLGKPHSFVIFLLLCLRRPWKDERKISLSDKVGRSWADEVDRVLKKIDDQSRPELPDTQTLRKLFKKKDFIQQVENAAFGEHPFYLAQVLRKVLKLSLFPDLSPLERARAKRALRVTLSLVNTLRRERYVLKRDLLRKYHRHKGQLTFLLKQWQEWGNIEERKYPSGSTWITLKTKGSARSSRYSD